MSLLQVFRLTVLTHQICNNGFNLSLHHLHIFGGTFQGDFIFSLGELNVHLKAQKQKINYRFNKELFFF